MELPSPPSSDLKPPNELKPPQNIWKEEIQGVLSNIERTSSFAVFGTAENAPNPGLFIKSIGTVGLPLAARDVSAIMKAGHIAPVGKGEKTFVDLKVRNTWQLLLGDFKITNPGWTIFPQSIVTEISAGLGVSFVPDANRPCVRAEPYKLLLYSKGSIFKPHKE